MYVERKATSLLDRACVIVGDWMCVIGGKECVIGGEEFKISGE